MTSFIATKKHPLFLVDLPYKQRLETTMKLLVMNIFFQNITFQAR